MKTTKKSYSLKFAESFVEFERKSDNFENFISKSKVLKIKEIIKVSTTKELKKGDLYYKGLFGGYFGVRVAEEDRRYKTTVYKITITNKKITKNYLLWYLKQKPVQEYLSLFIKGSVIPFLPRKDFYELKIKLPIQSQQHLVNSTSIRETKIKFTSEYREVLELLYKEYENNEKHRNLLSCAVLAGAISEAILLGYLKDMGVKKNHLERKTFGGIIEIAEIKGFESFPYEAFLKIRDIRNNIHPEKLRKNLPRKVIDKIKGDLKYLDIIVEYFGI